MSISHKCIPGMCRKQKCCCSEYEIVVEGREVDRIISHMPAAASYATHLGDKDSLENIFEEDGEGDFVVDTDDDGLCFFAYRDYRDRIFCSLHSVAIELQIPYHSTKPRSCVLWPLAISEDRPLQLSIADDAFDFPCNKRRNNPGQPIDPNIAQIIRDVFGSDLLLAIEKAL